MTVDPAWVALSLTRHLGGKTFRVLLSHFDDDPDAILRAKPTELRQVPGIGPKIAQAITEIDVERVQHHLQRWAQSGVQALNWHDPDYPPLLKQIKDAPPLLFLRGIGKSAHTERAFAVIGTREPSPIAARIAAQITGTLVENGHTIISGLARGIDQIAHMNALADPQGRTLAVLGSGVLNVYPPEHRNLAQAVETRGAILCEVAPDATVNAGGLVARNRIITGICSGVVVVESEIDGGAMHAARFALAQGRKLYAVDLPAGGNQALIRENGAIPIAPQDTNLLMFQ